MERIEALDAPTRARVIKRWKWLLRREISIYTRKTVKDSIYRGIKPTGRYFGVKDVKNTDAIRITGTRPNAGLLFGFNAPVDKRVEVRKGVVFYSGNAWHTAHKKQIYSNDLGLPKSHLVFVGGRETRERPKGPYFGLVKRNRTRAYSLVNRPQMEDKTKAIPVSYDMSIADFIMENHKEDINDIIRRCGELAIEMLL